MAIQHEMIVVGAAVVLVSTGAALAVAAEGFRDYGMAVDAAESRGVVVTRTKDGRCLVLANTLDCSPRAYVLVTDIDSGKSEVVHAPKGVPGAGAFGSMLSQNGRLYTGRGRHLLEFDPETMAWTWHGVPAASAQNYMSFAEDPGGSRIWAAAHPTCTLVRFDPEAGEAVEVARLDSAEQYPQSLAVDRSGWVYAGIGTARSNLVAYSPESGEVRQLVDEAERGHGTGVVYPCADGSVTGIANGKTYRLLEGAAVLYGDADAKPARTPTGSVYYGRKLDTFPDGRILATYDLPARRMSVKSPQTGEIRELTLDYVGGGAQITSLATGPDEKIYASTCHPMHLAQLDPEAGAVLDLGGIPKVGGGNFCAMTSMGDRLYGTEYAGGRLWSYDPSQPWVPEGGKAEPLGIAPAELVEGGRVDGGHFTHLTSLNLAFLRGDRFGARGHFTLPVEEAGTYYVCVQPYQYPGYSRIRFLVDDAPVGDVVDPGSGTEGPGNVLTFGPFTWQAGEHRLSMEIVETAGRNTWASVMSAAVTSEPLPHLVRLQPSNPEELARWHRDICRPRTILAHPDGRHVLMAGFAGYGLCGGGIGVHDTESGESVLLSAENELLSGHSCITLKALPNGDLVGGTSMLAPGGGHPTAEEGEVFVLDWKSRGIRRRMVPVPGVKQIISIEVTDDGRVFGLTDNSTLFVLDPASGEVLHRQALAEYGGVPRHALQLEETGRLFAMMSKGILQIDTTTYAIEHLAIPPTAIQAGGACSKGHLYYASTANLWSFAIPAAPQP